MSKGTYSDFFSALGQNESGNNYSFVSSLGYLGRFQFGEEALHAVGFYNPDSTQAIDFIGSWTDKAHGYGVWDKSGFLNSSTAQDAATNAWFERIDADMKSLDMWKHDGQWAGGVQITPSGMIAGAHLVGVWALKSFMESNGAIDTRDGYGTPVSEYVSRFGGFDTPFAATAPTPTPTPTPNPSGGLVLTSGWPGATLVGAAGADTLNASQGGDVLTGGAGGDHFFFKAMPWAAGRITDFNVYVDKLDLTGLHAASGYGGANPIGDGYVRFEADGAGGTRVMYDTDGHGQGQPWAFHVTTLQGVDPSSLGASVLLGASGGGQPAPQPGGDGGGAGQVLTARWAGDVLTGGGGADVLNASRGQDQLTGGGGADRFVFHETPWSAGKIVDFTPGSDKIDVSAIFDAVGYHGADPIADGRLRLDAAEGGTRVYLDVDSPSGGEWPFLITTLQGVAPSSLSAGDWVV